MMKCIGFLCFLSMLTSGVQAQMQRALVCEDGKYHISPFHGSWSSHQRQGEAGRLLEGFPLVFPAHSSFKNFRNVTLQDLDGDGVDEIIFGISDRMYCYQGSELRWSAVLSGIARYPAAVGDLDGDGSLEIVVLTGYTSQPGLVHVFAADGSVVPGWPRGYGGFWKLSSPVLADLDGDDDLEIVFGDLHGSSGAVHAVHHDGSLLDGDWPYDLPNIPAATPSIADINADGVQDIVIPSTREIFVLQPNGTILPGWPLTLPDTKYSFQSPVLANLVGDEALEIIGTGHGDMPIYYALDANGNAIDGWPIDIAGWSFHPPTVIQYQGTTFVVNARPGRETIENVLFVRSALGDLQDGYPVQKAGGHQGVTTVADVDGDFDPDIVTSSDLTTSTGEGFIYAHDLNDGALIDGFPLTPKGWTLMNGATFGDVDGDQLLDMVVLTYTLNADGAPDTAFVYAYALDVPLNVWWPTYKGDNSRAGYAEIESITSFSERSLDDIQIWPNPTSGQISLDVDRHVDLEAYTSGGRLVFTQTHSNAADLSHLARGVYFLKIQHGEETVIRKLVLH